MAASCGTSPAREFALTQPATLPELQAHYGPRYRWLLLLAVMIGTMAAIMSSTIINVAVPDMSRHFALGQERAQWVASGFMLAMTVSMLTTPWLLERYGYRRTYAGTMWVLLAGSIVGGATVVGGLGGTLAGGWLADRLAAYTRNPYLALSGVTMALAAPLAAVALCVRGSWAIAAAVVAAQACMWCYNGPINTVLVNCVPPGLRVRAFSLSILAIHLLGDAISPPIVGRIADVTGSLGLGVALVPLTLLGGSIIWLVGWRRVPSSLAAAAGPG